jgi:hypothetical protein
MPILAAQDRSFDRASSLIGDFLLWHRSAPAMPPTRQNGRIARD